MTSKKARTPVALDESWRLEAACRGSVTDKFYPYLGEPQVGAIAVCAGCDVRLDCLDYALFSREKYGVWGGMTPQKRYLRRRRAVTTRFEMANDISEAMEQVVEFLAVRPAVKQEDIQDYKTFLYPAFRPLALA